MDFLLARTGIASLEELKTTIIERLKEMDLNHKKRDFMHLLFNESNADRILQFSEVVASM
jgi:hypothetical protein